MIHTRYIFGLAVVSAVLFTACSEDQNSPGVEYMPDMYRSPALEAYVDYGTSKTLDWTQLRKDKNSIVPVLSKTPPTGTVRYMGSDAMSVFAMPYPLVNTPEDYERSAVEIHSPILSTKENIERGKAVYSIMCTHCHGAEGHGDGAISKNGHIQGIPDYASKLKDLPEGKMYHSITYGKGLMGQHASQLSAQERWQIIEYVKCLQKGVATPEYDANDMLKLVASTEAAPDTTK
jgi:mono/diheme cytochrome c family protein